MSPKKKEEKNSEVHIVTVQRGKADFHLVGTTPLLHNCLSAKAAKELLLPSGTKTATEKKTTLKHHMPEEYNSSIYYTKDKKNGTFIQHLSSAFRGAMRSAALDLPGVTKSEIGRLLWVENDRVDIYGIPEMDCRIVRLAGMNRTPDPRTRCIMRAGEWACKITVCFTKPQLKVESVANLLAAAGMYIGIGDYRNEKGAGNYGLFNIVSANDKDYKRIVKTGGRKVQIANMADPAFYNEETEDLFNYWTEKVKTHNTFAPMTTATKSSSKKSRAKSNGVSARN